MKKAVDTTTIGGRIKAKRVEAGLSQEKLSDFIRKIRKPSYFTSCQGYPVGGDFFYDHIHERRRGDLNASHG